MVYIFALKCNREKAQAKCCKVLFKKKRRNALAGLWSNKIEKSLYKNGSIWYLQRAKKGVEFAPSSRLFGHNPQENKENLYIELKT